MDKKSLRKDMAAKREAAAATVDQSLARAALESVLRATTGPISFFWPIRTEIDARPVMEAMAKDRTVCLPLTHGHAPLSFRQWRPGAVMEKDGFGVPYPADTEPVVPEVLVIPMLGFDAAGHRLGYGAGHYDRTLAALRPVGPVTAIGFAFEAQRLSVPVPVEPTDEPLDLVVTEAGVHRING